MHIAVCVTGQSTCERLIHEGAALRRGNEDELYVLHVAKRARSCWAIRAKPTRWSTFSR